jgi:hypothetical protein
MRAIRRCAPDRDAHGVPDYELRDEAVEQCHAIEGARQTLGSLAAYVTEIFGNGDR